MVAMQYSQIIMFTKENLNIQQVDALMDPQVSSIWVKTGGRGVKSMYIGGVYREQTLLLQQEPNSSAEPHEQEARWKTFISQWLRASSMGPCIVIGDYNLDKIKWDNPEQNSINMINMMKDYIETLNYYQMIQGPTRFWPGKVPSAIDHCWTSQPQKIICSLNQTRSVGDHNLIGVKVRVKGQLNSCHKIVKRDRSRFDVTLYREKINNIDWSQMYGMDELNTAYNFFEERIKSILDEMAPIKCSQSRKNPSSWVSPDMKELIKTRDRWREEARQSNQAEAWENYRKSRNLCNTQIKKDRQMHKTKLHEKLEKDGNVKGMFQLAKRQIGWTSTGPPAALLLEGIMTRSPLAIANAQINHYHSKINRLILQLPDNGQDPLEILRSALLRWENTTTLPALEIRSVSLLETVNSIKKLSNGTSFGHNCLDALSIKIAAESLCCPINFLTNLSISTRKFANKWRIARVIPLYKGGSKDKLSPESYWPISLLPVTGKLVEMAVHTQIMNHMEQNRLWNHNNHAYRKYNSTTTAMMQLADLIFETGDRNMISTIMCIDQSAAFDSINFRILTDKLKLYRFNDCMIAWITEYLSFRTQYVSVGGADSIMKPISTGIPQGSILGPAIYSIYVNELSEVINDYDECEDRIHRKQIQDITEPEPDSQNKQINQNNTEQEPEQRRQNSNATELETTVMDIAEPENTGQDETEPDRIDEPDVTEPDTTAVNTEQEQNERKENMT